MRFRLTRPARLAADGWVDIEGGIATLFAYAGLAGRELPDDTLWPEDELIPAVQTGAVCRPTCADFTPWRGSCILMLLTFPAGGCWKNWLPPGWPACRRSSNRRPASAQLTQAMVQTDYRQWVWCQRARCSWYAVASAICFEHLDYQDAVTFTGSAQTGQQLRAHPRLLQKSIAFTMEADSLNCCVLGEDVTPQMPEFALFIKEVCREMTAKAGQKCTAIRRIIVPAKRVAEVQQALLLKRLSGVTVGDPKLEQVRMGALVSREQRDDVQQKVDYLLHNGCEPLCGAENG
jgi:oxepin-CoA hydrolase / 3-oxo-5,6-dehydrosuberyl-CoA semialdehyde dehydrogenase